MMTRKNSNGVLVLLLAVATMMLCCACIESSLLDDDTADGGSLGADASTTAVVDPTLGWLQDGHVDLEPLTHWILARRYRSWTSSSGIFPSSQGGSRVYLNGALSDSLSSGSEEHPIGAIAVRELFEDDLITPRSINLLVKLSEEPGDGTGWTFYELTDLEPGGAPSVFEPAAEGCMGCHAGPPDAIQSRWPLR